MLKGYEKLRIPDENKVNEMVWEVNWNPYDKETNNCKYIRVTFPGGKVSLVKKDYMTAALFAIGNAEEQRNMVPMVQTRSRWYETMISVVAKKKIEKGEKITFPLKLTLPTFSQEIIAEAKRDVINSGYNLVKRT